MEADAPERVVAGRYRLDAPIGSGGMGQVWRATDLVLGRTVAVKQVRIVPGLPVAEVELARARTLREARIAAALDHATAVRIFDVLSGDRDPILVLEYVPSRDLGVATGLTELDIARVGADVASALAAAHAAGIVHRDVKPANVLLLDRPRDGVIAKLTDFGISHAGDGPDLTHTGAVSGTPAYFAPEIARGRDGGPASDVYALGATLYAAVTGAPPFGRGDGNVFALVARIAGGGAPRLPDGPLSPLVAAMTADDPAARPSAAQVRDALRHIATPRMTSAQMPAISRATDVTFIGARPDETPPAPARRRRRPLLIAAVATAVALAVAGGLVGVPLLVAGATPGRLVAPPSTGVIDPATADPCDLVSVESLAEFGPTTIREGGIFGGCTLDIRPDEGPSTVLQLIFSTVPRTNGTIEQRPGGTIGVFPDGVSTCERRARDDAGTEVLVLAQSEGDRCAVADSAAETTLRLLNRSSPGERPSLADTTLLGGINACALLGDADLRPLVTTNRRAQPDFQNWKCRWGAGDGTVTVQYERVTLSTSATTTAGRRPATVTEFATSCKVQVLIDGPETSVLEALAVFATGAREGSDRCTEALTLATAAESRLPAP